MNATTAPLPKSIEMLLAARAAVFPTRPAPPLRLERGHASDDDLPRFVRTVGAKGES